MKCRGQKIQSEIKRIHDKRIEVINLGRDLAIENVQAEFENLAEQELVIRRWMAQNTGQTKMQREITDDVQKAIRGSEIQKAFEPESRFEIFSRDFDKIINKGLEDIFKQIDRDSQIDLEKRMEGAGGAVRSRLGDMAGLLEGESGGVFMKAQLDQFKSEQEAIVNAQNELRKARQKRRKYIVMRYKETEMLIRKGKTPRGRMIGLMYWQIIVFKRKSVEPQLDTINL